MFFARLKKRVRVSAAGGAVASTNTEAGGET